MTEREIASKIFFQKSKVLPRQKMWAMMFLLEYKKNIKSLDEIRLSIKKSNLVFSIGDPTQREMRIEELDSKSEGVRVSFMIRSSKSEEIVDIQDFSEEPQRTKELWQHIEIYRRYRSTKELVY